MVLPLIVIGGLLTLTSLLITAFIQLGNRMGWINIDIKWHKRFAYLTIILALGHGSYGLYLNL